MLSKAWLLQRILICLILTIVSSVIAYFYLDGQIVLWLSAHHAEDWSWMKLIRNAAIYFSWLPAHCSYLFFAYFALRIALGNLTQIEKKWLIGLIAYVIAHYSICSDDLREFLGRAWPATWEGNNLSFLSNGIYGFHLGTAGPNFRSFPSGHALFAALFATFFWYYFPRWRWLTLIYALYVMFVMVIQYYHFLSDVIVGAALGYLTMIYTYYCTKQHILELN